MDNFENDAVLELVQKWVDGKVDWKELPFDVQKALDVVMADTAVEDSTPKNDFDARGELFQ